MALLNMRSDDSRDPRSAETLVYSEDGTRGSGQPHIIYIDEEAPSGRSRGLFRFGLIKLMLVAGFPLAFLAGPYLVECRPGSSGGLAVDLFRKAVCARRELTDNALTGQKGFEAISSVLRGI
ncbi:hypothetical protein [Methylobacterium planeticum]|uniref:Uncharacterized protein n=1 Tax=Methylobacterium planeticum TaxID=2615211 RepID=A0A6N6MMY4_9HYPH|nr:hypothetical protein [Methylobacterium planeticum]KAB1071747.1 hypothetical protein F6X51_18215 [Methylobacterium planeticum]